MSVCIAAMYTDPDSEQLGLVTISDLQLTDSSTGRKSELGNKLLPVTLRIVTLGADDMTLFGTLINMVESKITDENNISVAEVADLYIQAEAEWRQEYIERQVLTKFGVTWKEFKDRLCPGGWSDRFIDNVTNAIGRCEIPYATDAIIAGVDKTSEPSIWRIKPDAKDNCNNEGYAIIGEGDLVAEAEFGQAKYQVLWPREDVLWLCYVAKKRSEALSSVGAGSSIVTIAPNGTPTVIPFSVKKQLQEQYDTLEVSRSAFDCLFYEQAGKKIKGFFEDNEKGEDLLSRDNHEG